MNNFTPLHFDIAKVLIDCANKRQLISYSELCKRIGYGNCRKIGSYIDPVTKFTYEVTYNKNKGSGVFISAIVVLKGTDKPSSGFIPMYRERTSDHTHSDDYIIKSQQERVFNEVWSNLMNLMKQNQ